MGKFRKAERLASRKEIEALFKGSNSFAIYPIRLVWRVMEFSRSDYPVQAGFSVSKKKFKRAVDRNLIKRRLRESYRLQKQVLYDRLPKEGRQLAFMFIYTAGEILPYHLIEKSMTKVLKRFLHTYKSASNLSGPSDPLLNEDAGGG